MTVTQLKQKPAVIQVLKNKTTTNSYKINPTLVTINGQSFSIPMTAISVEENYTTGNRFGTSSIQIIKL